jgi:sarcosine oxidase subunit alpha
MPELPALVPFTVNGRAMTANPGSTVAAALLANGVRAFRQSPAGEPRGPLCGIGICLECRLTINGRPHQKSCQVPLTAGMEITLDV